MFVPLRGGGNPACAALIIQVPANSWLIGSWSPPTGLFGVLRRFYLSRSGLYLPSEEGEGLGGAGGPGLALGVP